MQAPKNHELLAGTASIGASLDTGTTARRLADIAVGALGDIAVVNLVNEIGDGADPPRRGTRGELLLTRAALAPDGGGLPDHYLPVGAPLPPLRDLAVARAYMAGEPFAVSGRSRIGAAYVGEPAVVGALVPVTGDDEHLSLICAPLVTGEERERPGRPGLFLGSVEVWRREPFTDEDAEALRWLAGHAAVCLDNARRYMREHRMALTLQRGLLPQEQAMVTAGETAAIYLPARAGDDLSGDWFDVIPLSSARVALVVGDVVGYGVHAAATMGRMCTAVRTLSDLDLEPDELLTHLDDLVVQLSEGKEPGYRDASGSTCLYAVVDPVARRCAVASAGHPPPIHVRADGSARFVDLVPGPVLGVGGLAFDVTEVELADGDVLALYSDGLIKHQHDDLGLGMEALRRRLTAERPTTGDLHRAARRMVGDITTRTLVDDVTLLLARVHGIPEQHTASWEVPADPAAVSGNRDKAIRQVEAWDLGELALTTELVVSELVTNAIRYSGGTSTLRLIRESDRLVCEVSDPSQTAPHLKRAKDTDEGGRGLFITARLVNRWGVRYGLTGKTIWTEQRLPAQKAQPRAAA